MKIFGQSDKGNIRENNEDYYTIARNLDDDIMIIVCDGVGGSSNGELASYKTGITLSDVFSKTCSMNFNDLTNFLKRNIEEINKLIHSYKLELKVPSIGTTLTGIIITKRFSIVFNVGDSRVYTFSNNEIKQITYDHNVMCDLIRYNGLSYSEASEHEKAYHITRAIGPFDEIEPEFTYLENNFDYVLLCTDGLTNVVSDKDINKEIQSNKTVTKKIDALINQALFKGGYDNITAVLVKMEDK